MSVSHTAGMVTAVQRLTWTGLCMIDKSLNIL